MKNSSSSSNVFKRHEVRYIGNITEVRPFGPTVDNPGFLESKPRYFAFRRDGRLAVAVRFADENQYLQTADENFETHSTIVFEINDEK